MVDIDSKQEHNYHLITINGDVDASSSIYLDKAMELAVKAHLSSILVDCEQLQYISSAGLGVFMSYLQEIESSGMKLVLFGLNPKVRNTFEILGLHELLLIVDNKETAMTLNQLHGE